MANTTNFGWETPDDTDLVKDGAAAIRTLGSSIDTSLVDLKGGTTGQVLSKATNTDMDFTWVAQDDSNAIQNAIVDAKGDLIAATGADTPARLAVGTDGQVLKANSATATGLEWATDTGFANPMTTTGDTIYSSSGSTPDRLPIGTTGQVLTVAGGIPSWATPASAGGTNWSAVNSGGTNLTGAAVITISGISGADKLLIFITNGSAGANDVFTLRINADTGTNYNAVSSILKNPASYSTGSFDFSVSDTPFRLCRQQSVSGTGQFVMSATITGGNASGSKVFIGSSGGESQGAEMVWTGGVYNSSSTISSISVASNGSNFDNGKIYVYKSA